MSWLRSLVHKLNTPKHEAFLVLLALLVILRIPNLLEPYWYGDESIYLIIGNALSQGVKLYSQIIDHKTPIIYYLAMVPNQVSFRILLLAWMAATTVSFYYFSYRLLQRVIPTVIATTLFVLLTTLPTLEGNIPNGELFMMGFVMLGITCLSRTRSFASWLNEKTAKPNWRSEVGWLIGAGMAFGLAILTKVPALFDLVGVLSLAWFATTAEWWRERRIWFKDLPGLVLNVGTVLAGAVLMICLSVVYFYLRGSGQAYLDYGLLYNFRYAASWNPDFASRLVAMAFTLPGKVVIMGCVGLLLTLATRWLSAKTVFISFWVVAALVAATLSNRPYPHYLIQIVLPLSLLIGTFVNQVWPRRERLARAAFAWSGVLLIIPVALLAATWHFLGFSRYPTLDYYQHFWRFASGQISYETYTYAFNPSIEDNQQIIKIFDASPDTSYYVWGTNPILYAQHRRVPLGRFTVAFHVKDFQAFDEMLSLVKQQAPDYILVMNDDADSFPALNHYLRQNYMPNDSFKTMVLWKRMTQ